MRSIHALQRTAAGHRGCNRRVSWPPSLSLDGYSVPADAMSDKCLIEQIPSSIDRLLEAGFHVRQMDEVFHFADEFRWSLNCFLRALKEVPQIIRMELQYKVGFKAWFDGRYEAVRTDALIQYFGKQRDGVVHKQMLKPASSGFVGITEGRGIKLGIGVPIDPLQDSDIAMQKYLHFCAGHDDLMGVLGDDEESLPCIERTWKLDQFPDEDVTDLAARAWQKMADLMSDVAVWLGNEPIPFKLSRAPTKWIRIKMYDREKLREYVQAVKDDLRKADGGTE